MNKSVFFALLFIGDFIVPFVPLGSLLLLVAAIDTKAQNWLVNKLQGE